MKKRGSSFWVPFLVFIFGIVYTLFCGEESFSFNEIDVLYKEFVEGTSTIKDSINNNSNEEVSTSDIGELNELSDGNLVVKFLDVGQADAILISKDNKNMLIDAGNNEDGPKLVEYFKNSGITGFNYVIGTHAHEDHIGGMDDIIRNFNIDKYYMPDTVTTTRTFTSVIDELDKKNYAINIPKENESFKMGEVEFNILHFGTDEKDLNDSSIVIMLKYRNIKILFTGDAPSSVEQEILGKDIEADILKVGHHGSQYSSSAAFLKKVNPKYAIISVGTGNTYGHPKDAALKRLNNVGAKIYRTDEKGTIVLATDGNRVKFDFMKTDTNG